MNFSFKKGDLLLENEIFLLKDLDQKILKYFWKKEDWDNYLKNYGTYSFHFFIYDSHLPIGFASFQFSDGMAHLLKIGILPSFRGKGLGGHLLNFSIEFLKKEKKILNFYLEVESTNLSAIKIYKKSGFKEINFKKNYYSDGADALAMTLN